MSQPTGPQPQYQGQPYQSAQPQPYQQGYQQPYPPQYAPQPQPIIINNQISVGGGNQRRHGLLFHLVMFCITGGLWLFIGPVLALRKGKGSQGSVNSIRM